MPQHSYTACVLQSRGVRVISAEVLPTRRSNVLLVVLWSQLIGAAVLVVLAVEMAADMPQLDHLFYGGVAGIFGVFGLTALYRGLALGRMGIVAPGISAVTAAVIPIGIAAYSEGLPGNLQLMGFGLAVLAIWALSYSRGTTKIQSHELVHAVASGLGFGMFFVFIDRVSQPGDFVAPGGRPGNLHHLLAAAGTHAGRVPRAGEKPAGPDGSGGSLAIRPATRFSRWLPAWVAWTYQSFFPPSYPPPTPVVLAWLVLKERLTSTQWTGLAITAVSLALISL